MMKPRVYCAGKMSGLTYKDCTEWRKDLAKMLHPDFETLSPMRGQNPKLFANGVTAPCDSGFEMTRDLNDIELCDVVVARFALHERVSFGTAVELGTCIPLRKPVIFVFTPGDSLVQHPFVKAFPRGILVYSLEDAASYLYSMFNK